VPFRRGERPLHERLAEQGGIDLGRQQPPEPHDPTPRWGGAGIHGLHRPREWDAVVTAESRGLPGESVHFVALPDGSLVVDEDVPDDSLAPLADALEEYVEPPYRAEGVRRGEAVWAAAGRRIEVVELAEEVGGDELELAVHEGDRTLTVEGEPSFARLRELERLAEERGLDSYVARGERIDGPLWEVALATL
jgi:hypothetical protein